MALSNEELDARIRTNSEDIRKRIITDLSNPRLQHARTQQEWVALGGSPSSWEPFAEQHPDISLHHEEGHTIEDRDDEKDKSHGHSSAHPGGHGQHPIHGHGTSIAAGSGILEDDSRYHYHVAQLRQEYQEKRSKAIESLKGTLPPPAPPMAKPKMLDDVYTDPQKTISQQYRERMRAYVSDQQRFHKEEAEYQNRLDAELAKKGLDHATRLNSYYGSEYANQYVKTIDDKARDNYIKELQETVRNNPNTLTGKRASDKLAKFANAQKLATVFAANDFHIQLTKQQIERNFQQRRLALFESARRNNQNLSWEQFLKQEAPRLKQLHENVTKAGWTNAKDRFAKFNLSQYQHYIEKDIIKHSNLSEKEKKAKLHTLNKSRPSVRVRIRDINRRFVAVHIHQRGQRIATRAKSFVAFASDPHTAIKMRQDHYAKAISQNWQDTVKSWKQRWAQTKKVYNAVRHPIKTIQNLNPKKWLDNLNPLNRIRKWQNRIKNIIKMSKNLVKFAKNIINGMKNLFNFFKNSAQLLSKLPALINAVMGGVQALGNLISSAISGLISTVIPAIAAAISAAISSLIGLIGAAFGTLAGIAGGIFLIVLVLIIGVVIVILLLLFGIPAYEPSVHLTCNSNDHGYIVSDFGSTGNDFKLETVMNEFYKQYHIHVTADVSNSGNSADPATIASASDMVAVFDTICELFGHQQGSTLPQHTFNSFGTDVVGTQDQQNRVETQEIYITILPPLSQYTDCSAEQTQVAGNLDKWTFYGTENCVTGSLSNAQASPKLQYIVARTLGYSLVDQETYMKSRGVSLPNNNYDVLANFKTPLTTDGLLPTTKCIKDTAPKNGTVTSTTATDCLAEGIGSYFTYASYSDFTATFSASGNKISDLATQLVLSIQGTCKNPVNQTKVACVGSSPNPNVGDCLTGLSPNPGNAVVQNLRTSVCEDYALQCAGFAQAVAIGIGAPIGPGNAGTYNGNPPVNKTISGYSWHDNYSSSGSTLSNDTIQIGDIPIWSGSGCEHIAIVVVDPVTHKVPGQNYFTAAEANGFAGFWGPGGTVMFDHYTRQDAFCQLDGWWRKQ